ncbi:MAG: hypothetical protein AMK75_01375 [Planctomycetes bacterium SM23_65]|nr:MAG: hypothetical protein AMK75_01375 [Planctomycetes bacterium SM23_65]
MRIVIVIAVLCCVGFLTRMSFATAFGKDCERDSLSLNGKWEVFRGRGDEEMWKPGQAAGHKWQSVDVPGSLTAGLDRGAAEKVHFVWARKSFVLDKGRASKDVVLRWNGIRFGAAAWVNGHKVAEHAAIGPARVLLPAGVVKAGKNELLLKVPGWSGVAKSKSGFPLMPTGASTQGWGTKQAAIFYDIWLEFYDRACMKWVLAIPDVNNGTVTFRVWIDGVGKIPDTVDLSAEVRPWRDRRIVGRGRGVVVKGTSPVDIKVPIQDVKLWTLEERNLYEATLRARAGGKLCDEVRFRFGMREIRVKDGHYQLNGKPFWFRGSNLVNEWHWGDRFNNAIKRYIVDEARVMNLNSFRTHTCPPPHLWLDVADEHGTFFLAEFPVLYNYMDFKFTPEELKVWHRNAVTDATGWVTTLWNHPSVAMWVLCNESRRDRRWEAGPFRDHVVSLDPTRPTMRTGDRFGTKETVDIHTCGNYSRGAEGQAVQTFARDAARKDPKRTLTNSEYMNRFGDPSLKYLGRPRHPDQLLVKAEIAMEHTEAMRRLNFDGIFPYMYAGWTGLRTGREWRKEFPTPMAAALHSSMSPVLASIELDDRNFTPGKKMSTRVVLINEKHEDVPTKLDVYLTPKNPLFVPDADALKAASWRRHFDLVFKAASIADMKLDWTLPEKEGVYYLAAVLTRKGARAVVSQREVRAVEPAGSLKGRRVIVLGPSKECETWLTQHDVTTTTAIGGKEPDTDVILVWDSGTISNTDKAAAPAVLKWVKSGGKVVILGQSLWRWPELVDFKTGGVTASRVLRYPKVNHSLFTGIKPDYLRRWNGLPHALASRHVIQTALTPEKKLLWVEDPKKTVALTIPMGRGEIVLCLLNIKGRITAKSGTYDPVAERIFANLLAR